LFQYKNHTTGTSSTAAKFTSVFALAELLYASDPSLKMITNRENYFEKSVLALTYAHYKKGYTQTAPGRAPYFYEEENWTDDMELALASSRSMAIQRKSPGANNYVNYMLEMSQKEKFTPWFNSDTARHYQWYPFVNVGRYEILKQLKTLTAISSEKSEKDKRKLRAPNDSLLSWYKQGIEAVWNKARDNAFYRGVPFIWCSNNLTTSFATQCYWYRKLTGDKKFEQLEQANFDWLFGCNPWGTSMVYGLPANRDTPVDPHSAFTHLKNWPIDGGLVDGPVKATIFNSLKGLSLYNKDSYILFQSQLAVYHDDFGDYSTNEPTMDGTASLIYLLAAKDQEKSSVKAAANQKK
jgi:hypothetical protein